MIQLLLALLFCGLITAPKPTETTQRSTTQTTQTTTPTFNYSGVWGDAPRGLHVKKLFELSTQNILQPFVTCAKHYGSYFLIEGELPFTSASMACQSFGALLASIVPNNFFSLNNLFTWCSVGTDDLSLQPWVFGDSVAGNCPILQTSNNIAQSTTTVNCDNPVRPALCQIVSEAIQSFSTTLTITSSTATISITLTSTSTSTSRLISTSTANTTRTSSTTTTTTTSISSTSTSSIIFVTSTTTITGLFPSPTTTTLTITAPLSTVTVDVTGILVTVTTTTRTTTSFSASPTFTQIVCPFIINPSQSASTV